MEGDRLSAGSSLQNQEGEESARPGGWDSSCELCSRDGGSSMMLEMMLDSETLDSRQGWGLGLASLGRVGRGKVKGGGP